MPEPQEDTPLGSAWSKLALLTILGLALFLRLTGIDWDGYYHLHPDERYIVWVGTTIEFPTDWSNAFNPTQSSFNPFAWPPEANTAGIKVPTGEPRSYAYGHWPLYLGVVTTKILATGESWAKALPSKWTLIRDLLNASGRIEYHHMLIVGRALAALFDTLTVSLVFLIGRRLYDSWVGLLAAGLTAFTVLHIQQAHFYVTDPFLTTTVVGAVYWMIRSTKAPPFRHWRDMLAAGALVGLSVGAKFSAVMLILPMSVAAFCQSSQPPSLGSESRPNRLLIWWHKYKRPVTKLLIASLTGALIFVATNPFAIIDNSCKTTIGGWDIPFTKWAIAPFSVNSCYLKNISTQGAMVRGGTQIPFTFQYIGTPKYLYYLDQMARWGQGIPLAVAGFTGFVWVVVIALRRSRRISPGQAVLLAWTLPFFLVTGYFEVKFLRYLLPLTPFLSIYAAALLVSVSRRRPDRGSGSKRWHSLQYHLGRFVALGTLMITALWALTFVGLYSDGEHPWIEASRWIGQHLESGSTIATEHWDYALPVRLRDGNQAQLRTYKSQTLEWFNVEDRLGLESRHVDLQDALNSLADSDYLVLASNRLYGVIPRLPTRYPEVSAYYQLLMAGDLGWDLVHWNMRYPNLGSFTITNDTFAWPSLTPPNQLREGQEAAGVLNLGPADESFTVYDHPLVLIFENRNKLTVNEMEQLIRSYAAQNAASDQ